MWGECLTRVLLKALIVFNSSSNVKFVHVALLKVQAILALFSYYYDLFIIHLEILTVLLEYLNAYENMQ